MPPKKTYVSVTIQEDVYRLVEAIASARSIKPADYISDIVRPVAEADHAKLSQLFSKMRLPDSRG
jgi:hypothetical protein